MPQGSVLGLLLFLLYINDIRNSLPNTSIKLFADDTNLFTFNNTVEDLQADAMDKIVLLNNCFVANKVSSRQDLLYYVWSIWSWLSKNKVKNPLLLKVKISSIWWKTNSNYTELQTACGHVTLPLLHVFNGLARPADSTGHLDTGDSRDIIAFAAHSLQRHKNIRWHCDYSKFIT